MQLPKFQDVEELKTYIVDNVENFSADNTMFHRDFHLQKEIIRRYDEVLSNKANKLTVFEDIDASATRISKQLHQVTATVAQTKGDLQSHTQRF